MTEWRQAFCKHDVDSGGLARDKTRNASDSLANSASFEGVLIKYQERKCFHDLPPHIHTRYMSLAHWPSLSHQLACTQPNNVTRGKAFLVNQHARNSIKSKLIINVFICQLNTRCQSVLLKAWRPVIKVCVAVCLCSVVVMVISSLYFCLRFIRISWAIY